MEHGKNSLQFQWLTVPFQEIKQMDVTETLFLMLTNMEKLMVWFQKLVYHSQLQFGQLVDHKDVMAQEMELQIVILGIHVLVQDLFHKHLLPNITTFTHVKITS